MTKKIYRSAQGKIVDLGSLLLQNEHVRAVGNMNVNARGDLIDGSNRVIDQKNRQIQRQTQRQTSNVSDMPVATSSLKTHKPKIDQPSQPEQSDTTEPELDFVEPTTPPEPVSAEPVDEESVPRGGLAAAIARARTVKQELDKTPRQKAQEQGLKKI